jgi:hypothetical protein
LAAGTVTSKQSDRRSPRAARSEMVNGGSNLPLAATVKRPPGSTDADASASPLQVPPE